MLGDGNSRFVRFGNLPWSLYSDREGLGDRFLVWFVYIVGLFYLFGIGNGDLVIDDLVDLSDLLDRIDLIHEFSFVLIAKEGLFTLTLCIDVAETLDVTSFLFFDVNDVLLFDLSRFDNVLVLDFGAAPLLLDHFDHRFSNRFLDLDFFIVNFNASTFFGNFDNVAGLLRFFVDNFFVLRFLNLPSLWNHHGVSFFFGDVERLLSLNGNLTLHRFGHHDCEILVDGNLILFSTVLGVAASTLFGYLNCVGFCFGNVVVNYMLGTVSFLSPLGSIASFGNRHVSRFPNGHINCLGGYSRLAAARATVAVKQRSRGVHQRRRDRVNSDG